MTTDGVGDLTVDDEFPIADVGDRVWVSVHLPNGEVIESNRVLWTVP